MVLSLLALVAQIAIAPTGKEPSCLDVAATTAAIERDLDAEERHTKEPPPPHRGWGGSYHVPLTIRISSDDNMIFVEIEAGSRILRDSFFAPPCDAMPDAIAAFVASAVAPLPDLGSPEAADAAGWREATVDPAAVRLAERKALLAAGLRPFRNNDADDIRTAGMIMTAAGALGAGLSIAALEAPWVSDDAPYGFLAGSSAAVLSGLAVAIWPESDYAQLIATVGGVATWAGLATGVALGSIGEPYGDTIQLSYGYTIGSVVSSTALYTVDRLRHRPISVTKLRALHRKLDTPAERDAMSAAEVAAIEREFARDAYVRRPWQYAVPLFIGAALNLALLRDDLDEDTQTVVVLNAAVLALDGLILSNPQSEYEDYTGTLKGLGLDARVGVVPTSGGAAVSLSGTF